MSFIERIKAIQAAHDAKVAADTQAIADRDAQITALKAQIDAGTLTAEQETTLEGLEADLGVTPAPAP